MSTKLLNEQFSQKELTVDKSFKDGLPQLELSTLHELDRGKLDRQFSRAIARALHNISEFPCKGDKVECREIALVIRLTPEVRFAKTSVETGMGHAEASVPEIVGVTVNAHIKDKFPIFQTDDVRLAVDVVNGQIKDVRFNPNNNVRPEQMELNLDE